MMSDWRRWYRGWGALAVSSAAALFQGVVSAAQSPAPGIIERLTAETHQQAVACGRGGGECSVIPYELCASDGRYAARIATPFSRVASAVTDAIKAGRRPNPMTPDAATRWGIGVFVYPAENSAKAEAIQRLEIRRESRTIQPTTATVGPLTVKNANGSTKQLARGFFAFTADAFAPTADITVVFVGSAGETTCVIDRARLGALR
jgi:hypothetical protein